MPRKAIKCIIELTIEAVTCPGVWLPDRDEVYLSICLLDHHRRTKITSPVFPLLFHEKFRFEKLYPDCSDPVQVLEHLDDDHVLFELIQVANNPEGGLLLSSYEDTVREFLYPYPSAVPTYSGLDREVLMDRSVLFPGISPRLEFSTKTTLKESSCQLPEDKENECCYEKRSFHQTSTSGSTAKTLSYKDRKIKIYNSSPEQLEHRQDTQEDYPQERHHESRQDHPKRRDRPPFVVRRVDSKLTLKKCTSISPPRKEITVKIKHTESRSPSPEAQSVSPSFKEPPSSGRPTTIIKEYCTNCINDHSEKNCTVCRLYKQYLGKKYWGHSLHCLKHSKSRKSKSTERKNRAALDDEEFSRPKKVQKSHSDLLDRGAQRKSKTRPASPLVYKSTYKECLEKYDSDRESIPKKHTSRKKPSYSVSWQSLEICTTDDG